MNCRASVSVKSEMRASNDLSREAICELNLRAMATTIFLKFGFDGGLNVGWSPPHPPARKRLSWIAHWKGK